MTELKTKQTDESVLAFLDTVSDASRRSDCLAVLEMMKSATNVEPVMWGSNIVGFGRYKYKYEGGREGEWFVTGFSPRKNDLTLYIIPGFERYEKLMTKLGKHKTGRSCLYIKRLDDVDKTVLKKLIEESVKAMSHKRVDK